MSSRQHVFLKKKNLHLISAGELASQKHLQIFITSDSQSSLGHGAQSQYFKEQLFRDFLEMSQMSQSSVVFIQEQTAETLTQFKSENGFAQRGRWSEVNLILFDSM